MQRNDELEPRTPLTPAQIEAWCGVIEDKAWAAKAEVSGCRFVLGNLLAELQHTGLIDAAAFISRLRLA